MTDTREQEFLEYVQTGGQVEAHDWMPDEYRRRLIKFVEMHANSELMGGLTERDFIPRAPGMQRKLGTLAKTQDEIGHAHLLYMVAADLGIKTRTEMLEDLYAGTTKFHNVFHYRVHTWADQVAIAYLIDAAALTTQQAVFRNCSYGPYRRILKRVIAEEGFHMRQGEEMLLRLAEGSDQQHQMFQEALERWWEPAMHFFGPPSKPNDLLLRWHIKSATNEELRDRYIQKFVPQLLSYGFTIPDPELRQDPETNKWVIGPIDWMALASTQQNVGPDSARRIATARHGFEGAAWVRAGLEAAANRAEIS